MYKYHNNDKTYVKDTTLNISSLDKSIEFYTDVIGLKVLDKSDNKAVLGINSNPVLTLNEVKSAIRNKEGLYHIAFILPSVKELGNWLKRYIDKYGYSFGAGDHYVSKAIYFNDPDGLGIEVYADVDDSTWYENNKIKMGTAHLDIEGLLKLSDGSSLPSDIKIGHLHLRSYDIRRVAGFYQELGIDIKENIGSAIFMSFDGYHHHIAVNNWGLRNKEDMNRNNIGITSFTLHMGKESKQVLDEEIIDPIGLQIKINRKEDNING